MPLLRSFDTDAPTLFRLLPWNHPHGGPPRFHTVRRSPAEAPFIVDFMSTVPPSAEIRRTHTNLPR
ncbi:uncharacterized protein BO80DRAFT_453531 [Aspergillus ibericus CBS 121593]|uniref:Uncharacterized protein n=1 Tax=Aspergillus ibericus CBS 121593 TaxID=1448316 RepID=A0A395H650_9EURO|nr:uncharacterized protein BO96DRAFT_440140 [Aspergillus niger CBS 101883]XP_025577698.1 hypothetical protein BO80DRAFT_453531 [Aspergillus ibericus CBS 121593]PYH50196.1 hypothetical protein BO96DRAFT_440140 [Aspergillus niger CBS 101883]RAL03371.1 hypothetical protein BO80DRAFT_453531 [Aspergillus ibericus CBS 121593]